MSNPQKRGSADDNNDSPNPHSRPDKNGKSPVYSSNNAQNHPSLAARIQSSASGLARNAFLPSVPSKDAARLLSDGSKAASSSSSSALAAAEQYRESTGPSSPGASSRDQTGYAPAESFRSSSTSTANQGGFALPALTEDEFQRTYGGDISEQITDTDQGKEKGKGKEKGSGREITTDYENDYEDEKSLATLNTTQPAPAATILLPSDGDAVVSLLSDHTFDPEFPPSANEPFEPIETQLTLPQPTPAEIQIIESFRRQLPADPAQTPQSPNQQLTSFSLVPDIGSLLDTAPLSAGAATSDATALRDTVLGSLPGAADWISVEGKYHDEVWGYLQPTLEAAAKELDAQKDIPSSNKSAEGPAVRRLKLILNHMQH
ncbi:hypothetical protein ARAM_000500 [Aspergillus rambellii]|uniref:Uncharacterized protein n=1 Tax=Aspergillus rambellii TaxID=308745 RepID=A0A0F8V276_9EURO|nr:hypothetical protein ARAM_000500 [Aspergillus rambellii]